MGVIKSFKVQKGSTTYDLDDFVELAYDTQDEALGSPFFRTQSSTSGVYVPEIVENSLKVVAPHSNTIIDELKVDACEGKLLTNGTVTPVCRKGYAPLNQFFALTNYKMRDTGTFYMFRKPNGECYVTKTDDQYASRYRTFSTASEHRRVLTFILVGGGGGGAGAEEHWGGHAGGGGGGAATGIFTMHFSEDTYYKFVIRVGSGGSGGASGGWNGHSGSGGQSTYIEGGRTTSDFKTYLDGKGKIEAPGGKGGNVGSGCGGSGDATSSFTASMKTKIIKMQSIAGAGGGGRNGNGGDVGSTGLYNWTVATDGGTACTPWIPGGSCGSGDDGGGGGASAFGPGKNGKGAGDYRSFTVKDPFDDGNHLWLGNYYGGGGGGGDWAGNSGKSGDNGIIVMFY